MDYDLLCCTNESNVHLLSEIVTKNLSISLSISVTSRELTKLKVVTWGPWFGHFALYWLDQMMMVNHSIHQIMSTIYPVWIKQAENITDLG